MTFGKPDGEHFNFSVDRRLNWSVFFPTTRWAGGAIAFGFSWRPVGVEDLRPFFSYFYITEKKPFCRMYHLRHPYNVVRVG
jgi:hypothetical protein